MTLSLVPKKLGTAALGENFPGEHNPMKILSHLRIAEQGPGRAYWGPPGPSCFPRHRPFRQAFPFQGILPFTKSHFSSFSSFSCVTILDAWRSPSHCSDLGICNSYCHPIGYWGWESKCHFSFGAKESWVFHLTSKDFVQTLSKQSTEKMKLKATIHFFPLLSLDYLNPYPS